MSVPANGATVTHQPSDNTKPYTGTVSNGVLTVTYILDGDATTRVYSEDGQDWNRPTAGGGLWRRRYTAANPPTTPASGTYIVAEWTGSGWAERESGTWTAAA